MCNISDPLANRSAKTGEIVSIDQGTQTTMNSIRKIKRLHKKRVIREYEEKNPKPPRKLEIDEDNTFVEF